MQGIGFLRSRGACALALQRLLPCQHRNVQCRLANYDSCRNYCSTFLDPSAALSALTWVMCSGSQESWSLTE